MECELAQQKIALFAYGELPDDQCPMLESHLSTCKRCEEEFSAVQALQQAMALAPALEPSANLLAQARMQLEEALDNMPRTGWAMRAQQSFFRGLSGLGRAPIAATALLILGLGSGSWTGYHYAANSHRPPPPLPVAVAGSETIASVSSIARQPNSENVVIHFNRMVPETTQGSLDDPQIRNLLVAAVQSQTSAVAQNGVNLLAEECEAEHQCADGPVRQALLIALHHDKNAHVRLRALKGLKPYVAEDLQVRDGVLEALLTDHDPDVRSQAVELLQPVEADSSVREALHTVASGDDNPFIRTVSQKVLDATVHIQ
jgi:HEAT repeats/Putative zinc-finger